MKIIDLIGWHLTQSLLFLFAGWLFFRIRYRNKEKAKAILEEKYDGNYANISLLFVLKLMKYFFGFLLIISVLLFIASFIWAGLKDMI